MQSENDHHPPHFRFGYEPREHGDGRQGNSSEYLEKAINVLEDLWLSLGWNVRGFRDRDFDAAGWTAQGPFVRFRFRFNQESSREMLF